MVLLSFTGFPWVLLDVTRFYCVNLSFSWCYWVYRVSVNFSRSYWFSMDSIRFYWVLLGFNGLYFVLLHSIGIEYASIGLSG